MCRQKTWQFHAAYIMHRNVDENSNPSNIDDVALTGDGAAVIGGQK
jgi:hypothetical protein